LVSAAKTGQKKQILGKIRALGESVVDRIREVSQFGHPRKKSRNSLLFPLKNGMITPREG
jgi:hypothetical protein